MIQPFFKKEVFFPGGFFPLFSIIKSDTAMSLFSQVVLITVYYKNELNSIWGDIHNAK